MAVAITLEQSFSGVFHPPFSLPGPPVSHFINHILDIAFNFLGMPFYSSGYSICQLVSPGSRSLSPIFPAAGSLLGPLSQASGPSGCSLHISLNTIGPAHNSDLIIRFGLDCHANVAGIPALGKTQPHLLL
jgi:hypothetical protein|tara:strand:- start:7550 stop:7942 length:393 start_codon:yes stop_codon:yes gene_type:complete